MTRAHLLTFASTALAAIAAVESTTAARAAGLARREVLRQQLPGTPKRDLTLIEVTLGPGEGAPPHLHEQGVAAFVVGGSIATQLDGKPEKVYRTGEAWYEPPGSVHRVSHNASSTEPASFLAIYVAPPGSNLIQPIR